MRPGPDRTGPTAPGQARPGGPDPAGRRAPARTGGAIPRPEHLHPACRAVLAVVAHPDDETFGLGAVVDRPATSGAAVHLLCYTRGEASTLNETGASLRRARAGELRQASSALRAATITLPGYPDGRLARTTGG